ncbi:hypothetical protein AGDE_06146 [Angomonas deanei]|nr:hypothetical protein AGDE_06146 [Angomonas deanei]|eukprot:EPY37788.1 hypothetical protein AGDE_06146 [Angomonas deanei]
MNERAAACARLRYVARRYARSRDKDTPFLTDAALQLRDAYVHGLRYAPYSFISDARESWSTKRLVFKRSSLTMQQVLYCFLPTLTGGECPSYTFMRVVRGKSDEDVLKSCAISNSKYNNL